jgi:uncharacterized protein involved in exopolysaccharide biosynthesis
MDSGSERPMVTAMDQEIDLLEYATAILRNKYRIVLFALVLAVLGYGLTYSMEDRYESYVHLALVEPTDPGGISPDNRRAPEVISLVEHGFVLNSPTENYQERVMAIMRSHNFTMRFIEKYDLLPLLFAKQWDSANGAWRAGFKPDLMTAFDIFRGKVCSINRNTENDLMAVRMGWSNPQKAAELANNFVAEFNLYMKEKALREADAKIDFLREQLQRTDLVEMRKSYYRLIEAQMVIKMLATSRDEYVLEVLDPALPANRRSAPAKKRIVILAFGAGIMLGLVTVIGRVVFGKLAESLRDYRRQTEADS